MGGDEGPTEIASVVKLLVWPDTISASGARGVRTITEALELEFVLIIVLGAENVTTPDNAMLWDKHLNIRPSCI